MIQLPCRSPVRVMMKEETLGPEALRKKRSSEHSDTTKLSKGEPSQYIIML